MDDIKIVTGLSVNDLNVSEGQEKVTLIREHSSQEEKMDQCLIQGEGNDEVFL